MEAFGIHRVTLDGHQRLTVPKKYQIDKEKELFSIDMNDSKCLVDTPSVDILTRRFRTLSFEDRVAYPVVSQKLDSAGRIQLKLDKRHVGEKFVFCGNDTNILIKSQESFLSEFSDNNEIVESKHRYFLRRDASVNRAIAVAQSCITERNVLAPKIFKADDKSRIYIPKGDILSSSTVYCTFSVAGIRLLSAEEFRKIQDSKDNALASELVFTGSISKDGRFSIPKELMDYVSLDGNVAVLKIPGSGVLLSNPMYYTNNECVLSDEVFERQMQAERTLKLS